jgi:hypothetical protein
MRLIKTVHIQEEVEIATKIAAKLKGMGYHAGNSIIVTVSPDYSAIMGQLLRHKLSHDGEICHGFSIDVPYPDQVWDDSYTRQMERVVDEHMYSIEHFNCILVEAAIIRGKNYQVIVDYIRQQAPKAKVFTVAMFQNKDSKFKSDLVGEYYDDNTQDLTFWWEEYNKHWS